ncbi:hypothetical protein K461DRAFT_263985 [Myriangium duriaei CBS 260.36]|uniref:Zn(2)-C6 fungal-type domain-containing protein n=1 Tax=Myriangium duriaei CBS 260.36 TaxID=1168546 RepID=A0A9P4JCB0_9PEZI|nr:hypothetical protein K461DRAFT_263985 [Myriangium duriaei CBS 260.36]
MSSSKRTASESAPDNPKPRQKRYHQRAVWACDECRLRKIKCDGGEPCKHCVEINRDCSYAGRVRPSLPPTQRIRALEDTLRAVRAALDDARRIGTPADRYEHVIALLDGSTPGSSAPEDTPLSNGLEPPLTPFHTSQAAPAADAIPTLHTSKARKRRQRAWGYTSGFLVICRLGSLFKGNSIARDSFSPIEELFDTVPPACDSQIELPEDATVLDLYAAAFERSYPAHPVLGTAEIHSLLEDKQDPSARALLHAVSALGYLAEHPLRNCERAIEYAWRHAAASEKFLDLGHCDNVISVQTLLCLVLFSINTCHLWRAHTFSSIVISWVLQLGLYDRLYVDHYLGHDEQRRYTSIGTIAYDVHSYLCSILGLPLSVERTGSKQVSGTYDTHRVFVEGKRLDGAKTSSARLSDLHCQILEVTRQGLDTVFQGPGNVGDHESIDLGRLGSIEGLLQDLVEQSFSVIARLPSSRLSARMKAELELTAYACQLKLYMPFLQYLVGMANGSFTKRTRSQRVLACIKTASKTISLCDSLMRQHLLEPSSWFQTYALFLAVLTLVFLIAAHKGTTQPSQAWTKGESGIRIMAAMRCDGNAATKCLRCIRVLVEQLSHTVEFDVDEIEQSTPTLCGSQHQAPRAIQDKRPTIAAILNQGADGASRASPSQHMARTQASTADDILAQADDFVLFAAGDDFHFTGI